MKEHFLGRGGCEGAFVGAAVKEDFWPRFAPRGTAIVRHGGLVFSHWVAFSERFGSLDDHTPHDFWLFSPRRGEAVKEHVWGGEAVKERFFVFLPGRRCPSIS